MKKEAFGKEINRVAKDISWNYRAQKRLQTRYQSRILAYNIIRIVFAALTVLGGVLSLFFPLKWLIVLMILTAMVVLMMSIFDRNTIYKDMIFKIQGDLQSLWKLQEECRCILFDLSYSDDSIEEEWAKWKQLLENREELYARLLVLSSVIKKDRLDEEDLFFPEETELSANQKSEDTAFIITDELAK